MARPREDHLVEVICTHGAKPKSLGRVIRGAIVWHPACRNDRGVMRQHEAPKEQ